MQLSMLIAFTTNSTKFPESLNRLECIQRKQEEDRGLQLREV